MMIEVIDQYGERHRFDDNHCIHDADSATGVVQIGVSNDSGDYDVVATFLHPARFGEVSDDACFTLREVPAGIARQIEELRAENEKLKADAKYGWQAHELILKNQALESELAAERSRVLELEATLRLTDNVYVKLLEANLAAEREKVKALEATWIGYNKLQEQLAAAQATIEEAADEIESWGSYASEYFQKKHDLAGVVARFRSADQDALHEDRARAVELLKSDLQWREKEFGLDDLDLYQWLDEEAAAHRARKEVK